MVRLVVVVHRGKTETGGEVGFFDGQAILPGPGTTPNRRAFVTRVEDGRSVSDNWEPGVSLFRMLKMGGFIDAGHLIRVTAESV